jgi:large subunit ribosomal protein L10
MSSSKTKKEQVQYLEENLAESKNFIFSCFSRLSVPDLQDLRQTLRENGLGYKVIKNNLFRIAWQKTDKNDVEGLNEILVGQLGITFGGENLPLAAKIIKEYTIKNKNLEIKGGYFDGNFLNPVGVIEIAGLPTKSDLLASIARGINGPTTNIAMTMKEVIASLARAIKAVGEKKE